MILNYPPPTLIGYTKTLPEATTEYEAMVDRITGIYNYLEHTRDVHDDDFILILDGHDYFFQLPPHVMIRRFQDTLKENNLKLRDKYGYATVEKEGHTGLTEQFQKYTQRVLFGASKQCFPNLTSDAGCVTVPQSSLPPDAYGYKTDIHPDGHLTRPRWLNPSTVMGQVADLKMVYSQVLESIEHRRGKKADKKDYLALTQMYGKQEYVREMERRRSSNLLREWLYKLIGISDASNTTGVYLPLEPGRRYEYGIGLDYKSTLFFNMFNSKHDVEWLPYNNISKTSSAQGSHGVPRERRLLLPTDLAENIENPFIQPETDNEDTITPPYNQTIDALPDPKKRSWNNLPLLTNVHSAEVPALVHLDGDPSLRDMWWSKMWYHPWARALLRKYVRSPHGFSAAQDALLGGQVWWDMRGGRGGVWTDRGEWIDYPELCNGFERDVFDDGHGAWGKEEGASNAEPVYNQFGLLVKGKESPQGQGNKDK